MRRYLLILLWLPLFGQVPNTNTFSFLDVKNEIESNGGATTNSLVDAFANANASGFDPAYEGSKNSLLNFRNYTHCSIILDQDFDTTTQTGAPNSVFVTPDGSKMYLSSGATVYYYTLSGGNVSGASYQSSTNTGVQNSGNTWFTFNSTGSKMYIISRTNETIYQYSVSSGSITYDSKSSYVGTQLGAESARDVSIANNNRFYVLDTSGMIYQYNLSTASDISTSSYSSRSFDTTALSLGENVSKIYVKSDGTKIYLMTTGTIYECDITSYNIDTLTFNGTSFTYISQILGGQSQGFDFNTSGDILYLSSQPDDMIYQFDLTCPWTIN